MGFEKTLRHALAPAASSSRMKRFEIRFTFGFRFFILVPFFFSRSRFRRNLLKAGHLKLPSRNAEGIWPARSRSTNKAGVHGHPHPQGQVQPVPLSRLVSP